jgi:non-ribosomal peptide synthetase component E (peptide arylation enzyme)
VPIAPKEIEDIVYTHPGIRDCALVAMPDQRLGERGCLFVVREPGSQPTLDEIRDLLAEKAVAKYKWPERLEWIEELPLNAARKVQKNVLRDLITAKLAAE